MAGRVKRLALNRETIRALSDADLDRIVGGMKIVLQGKRERWELLQGGPSYPPLCQPHPDPVADGARKMTNNG